MAQVTVAELKSLAAILGGGDVQAAIAGMIAGKPDGFLLAAETVASAVGVFLPPAAVVATGIDVLRKIAPLLGALHPKPVQPGDPAYRLSEGNSGFTGA